MENAPSWLNEQKPLESTVKHVASLSPHFNWVGIYVMNGDYLELGPFEGAPTEHTKIPIGKGICGRAVSENTDLNIPNVHNENNYLACSLDTQSELVVLIRNQKGKVVGQIDIDSHKRNAFDQNAETEVKKAAKILGNYWPDAYNHKSRADPN